MLNISKRKGIRTPKKFKKYFKAQIPCLNEFLTIEYKNSVYNLIIGVEKTQIAICKMNQFKSINDSIKALSLNISVVGLLLPAHFWAGLVTEVIKICNEHVSPASYLKEIFFHSEVAARHQNYPITGKWIRHPRTIKGFERHAVIQRKLNIPPSPLQYYIIELCKVSSDDLITVFRSFEMIYQEISYSYKTMTDPYSGSNLLLRNICTQVPSLLKTMKIPRDMDPRYRTRLYGSYQRGPNGEPAVTEFDADLYSLQSDTLLYPAVSSLFRMLNKTMAKVITPLSMKTKPDGYNTYYHSKIVYIPDGKFGKTRQIAICDMISQSSLTGINDCLMDLLRLNSKFDATFNQDILPHYLQYHTGRSSKLNSLPCSSDATAFTDRLPRILNYFVIKCLFGKKMAKLWYTIVFKRTFNMSKSAIKNGTPITVQYSVGSPMGLLTSWSSSALVHHVLVRFAHKQLKKTPRYIILGDDVCIWDRDVYNLYTQTMKNLGIGLSAIKSTNNDKFVEFAKRTFVLETYNNNNYIKEVTGLPATAAAKLLTGDATGITGYLGQVANRSHEVLIYKLDFDPTCWNLYSNDAVVASRVCNLLSYLMVGNRIAYSRVISFLMTWPFQGRSKYLNITVPCTKVVYQLGLHNSVISSIILYGYMSPADFLREPDFLSLSKADLNGLYQVIMMDDLSKDFEKATDCLSKFDSDIPITPSPTNQYARIEFIIQICHLIGLSQSLCDAYDKMDEEQIDVTDEVAIKLLFDCKILDLISRVEQISEKSTSKRRDLIMIRNSRLGTKTQEELRSSNVTDLLAKYKYTDFKSKYFEMSAAIMIKFNRLRLRTDERSLTMQLLG